MRLKHIGSVPLVSGQLTINDKNLNYEIETAINSYASRTALPINDKNLNYEIETLTIFTSPHDTLVAINDKNLNYEIETNFIIESSAATTCYQ